MKQNSKIKVLKPIILGVIPAFIASCFVYLIFSIPEKKIYIDDLPGKALASYPNLYPITYDQEGNLSLDISIFMDAINYLLNNKDPRAAADLLYLGQSNNVNLLLSSSEKLRYAMLHDHFDYSEFEMINEYRNNIFHIYRDIVNGIGQTFTGTGIEIVLHDTRNPLKSIVAIQNPISGRRLGDSNTNFGLELIKDYSILRHPGSSYINYELTMKDGRQVKSSTIPLYDKRYGLIGFICLNIDISRLSINNLERLNSFISNFTATVNNQKIEELIENSQVNH
jgi:predicted transcriptional regulator YheO